MFGVSVSSWLIDTSPLLLGARAYSIFALWMLLAGSLYAVAFPSIAAGEMFFNVDESIIRLMAICLAVGAAVVLVDHYGLVKIRIAP